MNPALTIPAFGPMLPEILMAAGVLILVLFGAFRGERSGYGMNVIALALIPTAIAYTLGIVGIARLRPRFASLVGLSEVLFAVLAAWMLLGEGMAAGQVIGGAIVLVGLALARQGDRGELLGEKTVSVEGLPESAPVTGGGPATIEP